MVLVALALVVSSCSQIIKKPVLHSYALSDLQDIKMENGTITANLGVTLDLENPAGLKYFAESLKAVLYKTDGTLFGVATLREPIELPKKTRQRVVLPLKLDIEASPVLMALNKATGRDFNIESMMIDLTGVVGANSIKKKIHIEQQSVKELLDSMK